MNVEKVFALLGIASQEKLATEMSFLCIIERFFVLRVTISQSLHHKIVITHQESILISIFMIAQCNLYHVLPSLNCLHDEVIRGNVYCIQLQTRITHVLHY